MRVTVDASLFSSPTVDATDLLALFRFSVHRPHCVLPEPLDTPEEAAWLRTLGDPVREELKQAMEISLESITRTTPPVDLHVAAKPLPGLQRPVTVDIGQALRLLPLPLAIVVENARNDQAFLFAVADRYQRQQLRQAVESMWIRFENGGGITEMLQRAKEWVGENLQESLRSFWIFDSDALAPGHPSATACGLDRECKRARIEHHQLRRRMAESYLPVPAIRDLWPGADPDRKRAARAFARLSPAQRHHFNMKSGFGGDLRSINSGRREAHVPSEAHKAASELFEGISSEDRKNLEHGLNQKIRDLFTDDRLLDRDEWFAQDDETREMRDTIDAILDQA
jgi:hypothetical protein